MSQAQRVMVAGFALALDRSYQPATHMWVLARGPGRVRVGMDPLGAETSGSLAQVSFVPEGARLTAGLPFGQLEAAKFVGPLISPVAGALLAVNDAVVRDAGLVERDPYGAGWMIEAGLDDVAAPAGLLVDPAEITAWFVAKVADYRLQGLIAQ
jgi:glycine cleavage system H protein